MARVCEQAQRYSDMLNFVKLALVEKGEDVSTDERNLLSVACKNLINSKRTARRTVIAVETNPKYADFLPSLQEYKQSMESQIRDDCRMIVALVTENVLSKSSTKEESRVFFAKMAGDYYRYQSEVVVGEEKSAAIKNARFSYEEAMQIKLPSCSQLRLSLVLNYAVFFHEVLGEGEAASKVINTALQEATDKIDDLSDAEFRVVKVIMA